MLVALLGWQITQTRIFWASVTDLFLYHYLLHPGVLVALPADRIKTFEILVVGLPALLAYSFHDPGMPSFNRPEPQPNGLGIESSPALVGPLWVGT